MLVGIERSNGFKRISGRVSPLIIVSCQPAREAAPIQEASSDLAFNDQCHMLSQSSNPQMGVPDELVSAIARRLVEGVSQMIKG